LDSIEIVEGIKPPSTAECESKKGTANAFKNKFQAKECFTCETIMDDATER